MCLIGAFIPLWILPNSFGALSAGAFCIQFGVQGAWGVVRPFLSPRARARLTLPRRSPSCSPRCRPRPSARPSRASRTRSETYVAACRALRSQCSRSISRWSRPRPRRSKPVSSPTPRLYHTLTQPPAGGNNLKTTIPGSPTLVPDYAKVQGILIGVVAAFVLVVTIVGPECVPAPIFFLPATR